MKIVLAPDSFKGSLSAPDVCAALEQGLRRADPDLDILAIPLADGGEGTVDALVCATDGQKHTASVTGPLGENISAEFGILGPKTTFDHHQTTAVLEMAAAAGLTLVPTEKQNPLHTTTFGLGQLIHAAYRQNARRFIIGIGGSATNDGGCGMAQALGVKFFNQHQNLISEPLTGGNLHRIKSIDTAGLDPDLAACTFTVACDVDNPLLGPKGATRIYSPQKGASPDDQNTLEQNLSHAYDIIEASLDKKVRHQPGAGAAGGLGAGLLAFLDAKLDSGIDIVLQAVDFQNRIAHADLVITGEGRIDHQTAYGKVIAGLCRITRRTNTPVIALGGSLTPDAHQLHDIGVHALLSICPGPVSLDDALQHAPQYLAQTAQTVLRLIRLKSHPS